jgi:putative addiction module component (TIGR02574 family)
MDITARKYKFIEEFMKIISPEKIEKLELLEDVLHAELPIQDEYILTQEQKAELDRREARHLSGESKSHSWAEVKQRLILNGLQTEN